MYFQVFWGVASYDHYLYISDIYPKFMTEGKKYMMWVVTKKYITDPDKVDGDEPQYIPEDLLGDPANEQKNFRYSINGRPRGVAGTVLKYFFLRRKFQKI